MGNSIEWIGKVPNGWSLNRIQNCIQEVKIKNNPIQTTQVLSLVKDKGILLYENKGNQGNKAKEDVSEYKLAYPNTMIVNSMNILIGAVGISDYFGCVSPVYYVFKEREVYMTEAKYDRLAAVLKKKKNIILQGAPGVGKTFAAKRLAYSVMGEKDDDRIEFVQFHQNYSYEDFMMGYKPVENGFELKYGIFYRFCKKAANHPDKDYFFIIDEINRGNTSKIFGELLMLIEADYRDKKATLAYNGLSFSVPKRLHIIGMMNTADRSLAMIDYALRRRFSFFDMEPGFDSEGFINYQNSFANETFNTLIERIKELNKEIAQDKSLGKGFCIGHSYFCNADDCTEEWMKDVVDFEILPMLSEYWFDESSKLQRWENILHGVFQ